MNLLLSILTSDWFIIFAIVWAIIAIICRDERSNLMGTIEKLVTKPVIFHEDPEPTSIRYYARKLLETIAKALTVGVLETAKKLIELNKSLIKRQQEFFSKDETGFRKMIGSVILLIIMGFFLWADLIAIFNTLEVFGIMITIPVMFQRYEWAVTFGSFFTIVIAGLILYEIFGKSEFTSLADQPRSAKLITTWLAVILTISGLAVVMGLGLIRFRVISQLSPDLESSVVNFNNLVIVILVPANTILSTTLIVGEGLKGIPLLFVGLGIIFISLAVAFLYFFTLFNYVFWFSVDLAYRGILIVLFIISFLLLTPLDKIFSWKPFEREDEDKLKDKSTTSNNGTVKKKG